MDTASYSPAFDWGRVGGRGKGGSKAGSHWLSGVAVTKAFAVSASPADFFGSFLVRHKKEHKMIFKNQPSGKPEGWFHVFCRGGIAPRTCAPNTKTVLNIPITITPHQAAVRISR